MKKVIKRFLSIVLTVAMIMSLVSVPTFAAPIVEGTNGNTIYISLTSTSDNKGTTPTTNVSNGDKFYLWVNFAGNPAGTFELTSDDLAKKGVWAYNILIGYDKEKMSFGANASEQLTKQVSYNPTYGDGVAYAGWANAGGICSYDDDTEMYTSYASGSLFRLTVTALTDLTEADLKAITFVDSYEVMNTKMSDGDENPFTLVVAPAIAVGEVDGEINVGTTADEIKDMIEKITYIDETGAVTEYTSDDAEWTDLSVSLPEDGLAVGKATLVASYNGYKCEFEVDVTPKSITGAAVSLKIGEGAAVVTSEASPATATYTGAAITPEVTAVEGLTADDYTVEAVASQTNVGDTVYTVAVTGKGNYKDTAYGYWKITPAEIAVSGATVADKKFDGNTAATVTAVEFTGLKGEEALAKDTDYEVTSATYADVNVGDAVAVNGTVVLKDTAVTKNYKLSDAAFTATGKITKADAPTLGETASQTLLSSAVVTGSKEYSFNLATIITSVPADAGALTYAVKTEGSYASAAIDGSNLKVTVAEPQTAGTTDTVVVTVSSANYEDADVTVNFDFKDKSTVEVTLENTSTTYGTAYTVSGSYADQPATGYTWTYTYTGIEGTTYGPSTEAPKAAGTYQVVANYEDNTPDATNPEIPGHVGSATATITIEKRALTLTAGDVAVTKVYDGEVAPGTLSGVLGLDGIVDGDEVAVDMTNATVGAYSAAGVGTYTVEIGGFELTGAAKDNYSVATSYNFADAKITKQLQAALTINDATENITRYYAPETVEITVGGGNGEGAYNLVSSDDSVLSLAADDDATWIATIKKAGSVTLTATKAGDDNYEPADALVITYTINPKEIADTDFTFDLDGKTFTGSEIKPEVTSETLTDADYEVEYSNNVNAGEATITVTGKDNYIGEVEKTFTIAPKAFNETEFAVSGLAESYTYTGSEIAPLFDFKWGDTLLVKDTDYEVEYNNNTNAGDASITITGKGNYSGELGEIFVINPAVYTGNVTITANTEVIATDTILTADAPAGDTLTYQWKRDGEEIADAIESTYTVTVADTDAEITVVVTSEGNYVGSIESASVAVGKAVLAGTVAIVRTDDTITATITDAPAEENYDIVWMRDGEIIEGAEGTTYEVSADDKGSEISVKIVAKGDTYTGEVTSNVIGVAAEAPSFDVQPTATAANASATVTFNANANGSEITAYQIYVDGAVVATVDGTQTSYTIAGLVNGTAYTVKVAAVNAVGTTESEELTVTPRNASSSSGGSYKKTYTVTVKSTNGGTAKANFTESVANRTITVTVTPDKDYEVAEITAVDKNGDEVELTEKSGKYTFTMPASSVTINVEFTKTNGEDPVDPVDPVDPTDPEDPTEPSDDKFTDVEEGAYYYDAVDWAVENGITTGLTDTTFGPESICTRAQMVTFLWRAAGSPKAENAENKFVDVAADAYYYDAVMWALENGITTGTSDITFSPEEMVSRGQTVTFLWRLAGSSEVEAAGTFADVAADAYYYDAVEWALNNEITNGLTDTTFGPDAQCTRGQIVTFLYRYAK